MSCPVAVECPLPLARASAKISWAGAARATKVVVDEILRAYRARSDNLGRFVTTKPGDANRGVITRALGPANTVASAVALE